MASIRIEYVSLGGGPGDDGRQNIIYSVLGSEGAPLAVTSTATSGGSRPEVDEFGGRATTYVRLTAIGDSIYMAHGADPTAAATGASLRLAQDIPEVVRIPAGNLMSFVTITES